MAFENKRPHGTRINHKRGVAAAALQRKRDGAQARQIKYDGLTLEQKLAKAGAKERAKLLARQQNQKGASK